MRVGILHQPVAEEHEPLDPHGEHRLFQRFFGNERGTQFREFAFIPLAVGEEIFGNDEIQNRVPEKFKHFVVFRAAVFVGIGRMRKTFAQEHLVLKRVADLPFRAFDVEDHNAVPCARTPPSSALMDATVPASTAAAACNTAFLTDSAFADPCALTTTFSTPRNTAPPYLL